MKEKKKRLKYFSQININTRGTFIPSSVVSGYTVKPLLDSTHPPFVGEIQIMPFSREKKNLLFSPEKKIPMHFGRFPALPPFIDTVDQERNIT